jgi:hypothetical protein
VTEYIDNMKNHELASRGGEPKLTQIKEKVKPFEGNYNSVYQDYTEHKIDPQSRKKGGCTVTLQQKEEYVMDSVQRIMENPEMARKVFS